jgi:hypothetical protein
MRPSLANWPTSSYRARLPASVDPRLARAISTPSIQNQADELIRLALRALEHLKRLDESLYERFVAMRTTELAPEVAAEGLRTLWDDTFGALLHLLSYCRSLTRDTRSTETLDDASFDFGELDGGDAASEPDLDFGAADLGELLDVIDEHRQEDDAARWAKVLDKVRSIEYGLRTQYADAASRMNVALGAGERNQVLGLLDDLQSSASEGVHALVAAIYEAFLPEVSAATVVPGYLTTLGRALLVRRGLAELATTLAPYNDVLQSDSTQDHAEALARIRDVTRAFVGSVVCRAMRAADRWEMVEFERKLAEQPLTTARLTAEGLVKYLESLGSINQREVLLVHDQRALEEIRESLTNARELVDLSPRTANEMIERALQAAQRLRGRHPATDQLLGQLERYAATTQSGTVSHELVARLEMLLARAS